MNYINVNNLYNYYNRNNTFASNLVYFLIHNFLDILVVSCDLITDVALHCLADIHRSSDATVTALFSSIPETSADREVARYPKAKKTTLKKLV